MLILQYNYFTQLSNNGDKKYNFTDKGNAKAMEELKENDETLLDVFIHLRINSQDFYNYDTTIKSSAMGMLLWAINMTWNKMEWEIDHHTKGDNNITLVIRVDRKFCSGSE